METKLKANKGEWSEFYTLLKLLAEKRLYAADDKLEKIKEIFYPILKVITAKGTDNQMQYEISEGSESVKIYNPKTNNFESLNTSVISDKLEKIFLGIKNSAETTFEIGIADELLEKLHCHKVQASSAHKADIFLVIHDLITGIKPEVGFSIKSRLGSPSTLLNASGATNFIFEIEGFSGSAADINSVEGSAKIRDRLKKIYSSGGKLKYIGLDSSVFQSNLRKIDSMMPDIIAEMLLLYYQKECVKVEMIAKFLEDNDPLKNPYFKPDTGFYEYKIKHLLLSSALGMMPSSQWNGLLEAQGGYIIVREDGEIVCYHIYNQDQFKDYLFNNTRLETPSSTRHKFGFAYEEDGKMLFKLNLQIRFTD